MIAQPNFTYFVFYNTKTMHSFLVILMKVLLTTFFPPYSFSLAMGQVMRLASTHYDDDNFTWVKGVPYDWSDFVKPETGKFATGEHFDAPAPFFSFMMLLVNVVVYAIFTWYFDHVLASNRGVSE